MLSVAAGGGCLDVFFFSRLFFLSLIPSLLETTLYRLKYSLKEPLNRRKNNQPIRRAVKSCLPLKYQRGPGCSKHR